MDLDLKFGIATIHMQGYSLLFLLGVDLTLCIAAIHMQGYVLLYLLPGMTYDIVYLTGCRSNTLYCYHTYAGICLTLLITRHDIYVDLTILIDICRHMPYYHVLYCCISNIKSIYLAAICVSFVTISVSHITMSFLSNYLLSSLLSPLA